MIKEIVIITVCITTSTVALHAAEILSPHHLDMDKIAKMLCSKEIKPKQEPLPKELFLDSQCEPVVDPEIIEILLAVPEKSRVNFALMKARGETSAKYITQKERRAYLSNPLWWPSDPDFDLMLDNAQRKWGVKIRVRFS